MSSKKVQDTDIFGNHLCPVCQQPVLDFCNCRCPICNRHLAIQEVRQLNEEPCVCGFTKIAEFINERNSRELGFEKAIKFLWSPGGRSPRLAFWLSLLIPLLFVVLLFIVERIFPSILQNPYLAVIILFGAIVPYVVLVRRCHDIGRSGWEMAFPIIGIICVIDAIFQKGEDRSNKYGPPTEGSLFTGW
jgi:uncharacterized membrane protein YhaH (DUF805 family)